MKWYSYFDIFFSQILGWPKSQFSFFCKIKGTFFIYTNNFIDLDILSMLAISCYWLLILWVEARGAAKHLPMHKTAHSKALFGQNVNSTKKLWKPLLTHLISHSTFSICCTNLLIFF